MRRLHGSQVYSRYECPFSVNSVFAARLVHNEQTFLSFLTGDAKLRALYSSTMKASVTPSNASNWDFAVAVN